MLNFRFKIKYRLVISSLVSFMRIFSNAPIKLSPAPFFILGSGRNGSTLLASILNAHKDVFVPPEQFILPYTIFKRYLKFYWPINNLKQDILNTIKMPNQTLNWKVDLRKIELKDKSMASLFNSIYRSYAKQVKGDVKIWGDKTPLNIHFSNFIYPEFPNAKYIFLIRDPRDVALSYKKLTDHKAKNTDFAIWKWNDSVKMLDYLLARTDVLIIKYEELVCNPERELKKILSYLEISEDMSILSSKSGASDMGVGDHSFHQNLDKPINSSSVGKWKLYLKDLDIKYAEQHTKLNRKRFGYPL
jgi:protein-tyrosine sulfotransferase